MFKVDKSRVIEPTKVYSKPKKLQTGSISSASYSYLIGERAIDENIISKMKIECYEDSYVIPFAWNGALVDSKRFYLKRGKDGSKFMKFETNGTKKVLFGSHLVEPKFGVLNIFEGEVDCMTALSMGMKNCVSIPNGVKALGWVNECYDFHMQFKEIFICFDADSAGMAGADEVAKRLGRDRCRIVNLYSPQNLSDINDLYIAGKQRFIEKRFKEARHPQEKDLVHAADLIEEKKDSMVPSSSLPAWFSA